MMTIPSITLDGKRIEVRISDTHRHPNTLRGYVSTCHQAAVGVQDDSEPATGFNSARLHCTNCGQELEPNEIIEGEE